MTNKYCTFPHCECSMGAAERCKHPKAPAATDTGLVTVGNGVFDGPDMIGFVGLGYELRDPDDKRERKPVVTRSQAEELLAAERAAHDNTIATLSSLIEDNAALIHDLNRIKDHETELVNDNDALTARIKELEKLCNDTEAEALGYASDKAELEVKLAAAEADAKGYKSTIEHLMHRAETAETSVDTLIGHLTDISGKIGAFHDADDEDAEMHILDDIQTIILTAQAVKP